MKKLFFSLAFVALTFISNVSAQTKKENDTNILVSIDLNSVKDDKLLVTIVPPKLTTNTVIYHIPKIVPGTYSEDDFGKFIDDIKAFDRKGNLLKVTKKDVGSWIILDAKSLSKITYLVNDTYDVEDTHDIFSPAGTNILDKTNFVLNLHGFVGYFSDMMSNPYQLTISHPASLWGGTSLADADISDTNDVFRASRYAELVDNPIMYAKPDYTTFTVDGMEVVFSVYSPNGTYNAKMLSPDIEKMVRAQKKFLGPINKNKKYTILLYLTDTKIADAEGFGALEHNTSTTVVFPELMPEKQLTESLIDVISHEFFHTVTPLSIHSKEIHYFDFNTPKMSQHLWMYEGVTEYFANLFQVNQGLISEDAFYSRMEEKIRNAAKMNDKMSFTTMSANVLTKPYKEQYLNVYEKGALIGMCIDIIIRENSNGKRGILDLMQKLSDEYGSEKPFDDAELIPKIVQLTFPEVGEFFKTYVVGETPIPYDQFLAKVGITKSKKQKPVNVFTKGNQPYVTIRPNTKQIVVINGMKPNNFIKNLGLQGGDTILEINGAAYNLDNIYEMVMTSESWKEDDDISLKIDRDGKEMTIKGKVKHDFEEVEGFSPSDSSKNTLREAWLKG